MKTFFFLFFLLATVLAVYPFLGSDDDAKKVTGLPWQIESLPDGSTRVFGINIGQTSLGEAADILGTDRELAIIAAADEPGSLEMYYGHYRAGLLSGKLVLQTAVDAESLMRWRDAAVSSEYMSSGKAKKYKLSADDLPAALTRKITGITFIPAVDLDEEIIIARFGEPARKIKHGEAIHYHYPDVGLDLALYAEAKEVLQYVSPAAFERLVEPLVPVQ